ncbi:MAG: DUF3021 domain-containing protein [Clostridia bacterium]|nr:DUF3021 domain-containing protein [Clostridia bacterium]
MKKKVMEHVIVGLGIGFVVTTVCLWIFKLNEATGAEVMREFTVWLIASALYGLISLIYDSNMSLPLSCAIHFIACALVTFIASVASGIIDYFAHWYEWFIYVLPVFVLIYLVIGTGMTIVARCQAKKINEKISKKSNV